MLDCGGWAPPPVLLPALLGEPQHDVGQKNAGGDCQVEDWLRDADCFPSRSAPTIIQEIEFAPDSPLEEGVSCELVSGKP